MLFFGNERQFAGKTSSIIQLNILQGRGLFFPVDWQLHIFKFLLKIFLILIWLCIFVGRMSRRLEGFYTRTVLLQVTKRQTDIRRKNMFVNCCSSSSWATTLTSDTWRRSICSVPINIRKNKSYVLPVLVELCSCSSSTTCTNLQNSLLENSD